MNIKTERQKGFESGSHHGEPIQFTSPEATELLWSDNLRKSTSGIKSEFPLVRAYWEGYREALAQRENI